MFLMNIWWLISSLEYPGIKNWVISSLTINYNNVDACNSDRSGILQSILDELFLDSNLKISIHLYQFLNDVIHVLFNLVLFFDLKSTLCFRCEFRMIFIVLFTNEYLEVVKLWWHELTLDGRQLIGTKSIISSYLNKPFQIKWLILVRIINLHYFTLIWTLIIRLKLFRLFLPMRNMIIISEL